MLAGVASVFAALCYAEFASLVPMAGSAYTYGYATLGELIAWIIGWDLILEYALGAVTVAIGWSGYVVTFLHDFGINVPCATLRRARDGRSRCADGTPGHGDLQSARGHHHRVVTDAARGRHQGVRQLQQRHRGGEGRGGAAVHRRRRPRDQSGQLASLHPAEHGDPAVSFGWSGVMTGAGIVFFAYIGFDAVSTAAQEAKNPQKDMPIGIIGSLLICTVLYILVSAIATGVVPYKDLDVPDPIAVVGRPRRPGLDVDADQARRDRRVCRP